MGRLETTPNPPRFLPRLLALMGLLVLMVLLAPALARSQSFTLTGIGGRVGMVDPEGGDSTVGLGFHLEFAKPGSRWHLAPEILYWSDDPLTDVSVGVNGYYHFLPPGRVTPYVGAGAGIHFYSFDVEGVDGETDAALNLLGGVRFPLGENAHLFAEVRYVATDLDQVQAYGGFTVPLAP
jgi:hypothetical protein